MEHKDVHHLMDAGIDGELDLSTQLALDAHLAACGSCRAAYAERKALVGLTRAGMDRFAAPDDLRARLRAALPGAPAGFQRSRVGTWPWLAGALSLASAALATGLTLLLAVPAPRDSLPQEIVAAQVRSLMAGHLTDVASSDQHTVKPWFNGRIDVSPPVPDLGAEGFPLIGGRLDYLGERPAAALVYGRRRHVINLFVWSDPGPASSSPDLLERQGYNLLRWNQAGFVLWAVSDLSRDELTEFQRLWAQAAAR